MEQLKSLLYTNWMEHLTNNNIMCGITIKRPDARLTRAQNHNMNIKFNKATLISSVCV